MFNGLFESFNLNEETIVLLSLFFILLAGFLVTRITKLLKLPNVSGYIIAGVLIGPNVLHLIPSNVINNMNFMSDIALAFIAFGVGKFFKKEEFAKTGKDVIIITILEALLAGILVTTTLFFIFKLDWNLCLILGAIATSTAPASTMMTINQYHARGKFVTTLLQVVALDDVICLLIFSIVTASINGSASGTLSFNDLFLPILYNIVAILLGFLSGLLLSKLLNSKRSFDNRLILVVALLLGLSGLCSIFDTSPLLSCMVFGAVYINKTKDKELFRQINGFTPPIMSIFFILSGMKLDISALGTFGIIGIVYFLVRIIGKYFGAFAGTAIVKGDKAVRNYLGLALIPQAGVSIGLAYLGQRILPPEIGNQMMTIILASSVLYEMIGPVCAKLAIKKSGNIKPEYLEKKQKEIVSLESSEDKPTLPKIPIQNAHEH